VDRAKDIKETGRVIDLIKRQLFSNRSQPSFGTWSVDTTSKFALAVVLSQPPKANSLELFFGKDGLEMNHVNHVVRTVGDYEVHFVRWDENPVRFLSHLFEIFPNGAGARLDLNTREVLVDAERTLFSNKARSLSFCSAAVGLLNCGPEEREFEWRPQVENWADE
jgi:hypothetical protein